MELQARDNIRNRHGLAYMLVINRIPTSLPPARSPWEEEDDFEGLLQLPPSGDAAVEQDPPHKSTSCETCCRSFTTAVAFSINDQAFVWGITPLGTPGWSYSMWLSCQSGSFPSHKSRWSLLPLRVLQWGSDWWWGSFSAFVSIRHVWPWPYEAPLPIRISDIGALPFWIVMCWMDLCVACSSKFKQFKCHKEAFESKNRLHGLWTNLQISPSCHSTTTLMPHWMNRATRGPASRFCGPFNSQRT